MHVFMAAHGAARRLRHPIKTVLKNPFLRARLSAGAASRTMTAMLEMQDQQAATAGVISSVASKLGIFSGTGTAIFGVMTSEFFLAAVGAIGTIGTLIVNAYYKRKRHALEMRRAAFAEEMARRAEERRLMVAQVQMEVMRESRSLMAPLPDTSPSALRSRFHGEEGDGN